MRTTEGEQGAQADDAGEAPDTGAMPSSRLRTFELEDLVEAALSERTPAEAPEPDPCIGLEVDRRYVIESLIAAGGMGLVYRCRHRVLDKRLAIKIIRGDVAQMPDGTDRFLLEAKAASSIGHEHIVDIADFGSLPDGSPYLVMEYLDGISLAALLRREPELGVRRIARLATQIAEGLGAAHAAGIVHRDLKPDNVFVLERKGEDFIKILDFGVARMARNAKKLTQAGTIVGTPHYMSPEQALGLEVDHRGDIYALGVILYELCTRRVPFDGSHYVAVLHQHLHALPPPFSTLEPPVFLPPELEQIVQRCLAKSPSDRFASMGELSRQLAPFREASEPAPPVAPPAGAEQRKLSAAATNDPKAAREATVKLLEPSANVWAPAALAEATTSDEPSPSPGARPGSAPPPRPPRSSPPTEALPLPRATLLLPRLTGTFSVRQKRTVTGLSVLVLLAVCAGAALRMGSSPARRTATPASAPPAVEREPVAAPAASAPPPARPVAVTPAPELPAPAAAPAPTSSSSAPGVEPRPEPEAPPNAEKPDTERPHRGPPAAGKATKRVETPRSTPPRSRAKDDFMNPWPSPR